MQITSTSSTINIPTNSSQMPLMAEVIEQQPSVTIERPDIAETPIENYSALTITDKTLSFFIDQIKQKDRNIEELAQKKATLEKNLQAKEKECEALKQEFENHKKICKKELQPEKKQDSVSELTLEEVIHQLKDSAWEIRKEAIYAFYKLSNSPEKTKKYIAPLLEDEAPPVREAALWLVNRYFSFEEKRQKITLLLKDPASQVRQAAVSLVSDCLGRGETEEKILPLLKDPDWQVRQAVINRVSVGLPRWEVDLEITPLLKDPAWQVRLTCPQI